MTKNAFFFSLISNNSYTKTKLSIEPYLLFTQDFLLAVLIFCAYQCSSRVIIFFLFFKILQTTFFSEFCVIPNKTQKLRVPENLGFFFSTIITI